MLSPQPGPNVLFETGMAIGRGQRRAVLIQVGRLRKWSDIRGRHITFLDDSPEKRHELVAKLKIAGYDVDTTGQDWLSTVHFAEFK